MAEDLFLHYDSPCEQTRDPLLHFPAGNSRNGNGDILRRRAGREDHWDGTRCILPP